MKRFAALLLAFILIISLCACGKAEEEPPVSDDGGNIIQPVQEGEGWAYSIPLRNPTDSPIILAGMEMTSFMNGKLLGEHEQLPIPTEELRLVPSEEQLFRFNMLLFAPLSF